jgi:hypothetical protein
VSWEQKVEKLRAEFEVLDDTQKTYIVGIAKALAFASASEKAGGTPSDPDRRGAEEHETKSEKIMTLNRGASKNGGF